MNYNNTLLIYWAFGPSHKDRMISSIKNFTALKYFDILILSDNDEYFKIDYPNVVVRDIKKYMNLYPEMNEYEVLPKETVDYSGYVRDLVDIRNSQIRFPCNLQRYGLLYENINNYQNVIICDCDMLPTHDEEQIKKFEDFFKNEVEVDTVCSTMALYEWNNDETLELLKKYATELNKNIVNEYPIIGFDSLFKIFKFSGPEKIKEFFEVWNYIVIDTYKNQNHLLQGSWNILPEVILGVVYKLIGLKVCTDSKYYNHLSEFRNFTYPEDRYWDNITGNANFVFCETIKEAIEKNYEGYLNFYQNTHHDRRFQNDKFPYRNVYITLTTIPSRLSFDGEAGLMKCLNSLLNQDTRHNYEIHFNIPKIHKKTGNEYVIPDWLVNLSNENPKLKLFTDLEDMCTLTKLYYTISRVNNPEDVIIVCDDDLIYHPSLVDEQVRNQYIYENCAVGYDGMRALSPVYGDVRDYFVVSVDRNVEVNYLQHYKTVSYKRKFFEEDFFSDEFVNQSWNDDLILGAYMTKHNIKKIVTFYRFEEHIKTLEEWGNRGGVLSFPCLGHTHHEHMEGCNIFRTDNVDDNGMYFRQKGYLL